jgi:predicted neuraminidase
VDVDWLLDLGLGLKLVDQPMTAEWLGWGPGVSLPNRNDSALFGQWTIPVFSAEARTTRSGVEWLKVNLPEGRALLVNGLTAFRFDGGKGEGQGGMLRMLNKTAGASVKGGIPEREEWKISLKEGKGEFRGELQLRGLTDAARAVPAHPAIISREVINGDAPYPESHASTIVETVPGQLAASWFGGTKERNPDVCIWFARQEGGRWQPAMQVADGIQADGSPRLPTWNPVLFAPKNGPLQLFYKVGPHPSAWWGMRIISLDGGKTWTDPERLPEGVLGPIKNKPVVLADGTWLSPSSMEGTDEGWVAHFERSSDQGRSWQKSPSVAKSVFDYQMIQPSILFHPDGRLQAIGRTRNGVTASTSSTDQGRTWSALRALAVTNTNSGTDAVTLADGRHLLVFNDTAPPPERPSKGVRYPLNVAVSNDGMTWTTVATLDSAPCAAGYAYPAVIQAADGQVHITYTFDRKKIKHVILDPAKL